MCTECKVGILAQRGWGQPLQGGGGGKRSSKGSEQGRPPLWFLLPRRAHRLEGSGTTRKPQPGKGGPPIPTPTRCGRPWHTLLRTSPPPCPRSGGGPLCCTPGLGQTGSPGRLWRAWRCALAPHSFSGRPGPLSQSWRLARRHQERRRREALLGGAATLRTRLWTDGGGWDRGAPAAQEGQEEHRVRLSLGRAGLHL